MEAITRIMFCQKCYDAGYPRKGDLFIAYGSSRRYFFIETVVRKKLRGFSPHTLIYSGLDEKGLCKIQVNCAMNNCDVEIKETKKGYSYVILHKRYIRLSRPNWNALQFLKNDPQFEI